METGAAEKMDSMVENFSFKGPNNWKLYGHIWRAKNPKATLIGIHGYSEHGACYDHFAEFLNENDYDVIWMDLPGHGRSDGRKNNIDDFNDYLLSFDAFLKEVDSRNMKKPYHLFGHSLGGLVSMRFMQSSPRADLMRSLILTSPLVGVEDFKGWKLSFMRLLVKVAPNLGWGNDEKLGEETLTHDVEMREKRKADPLIKARVTINWCREYIKAKDLLYKDLPKLTVPLYLLQAELEKVTDLEETKSFFPLIPSKSKEMKIYDGFCHEILNEIGRDQVMKDILVWLNKN